MKNLRLSRRDFMKELEPLGFTRDAIHGEVVFSRPYLPGVPDTIIRIYTCIPEFENLSESGYVRIQALEKKSVGADRVAQFTRIYEGQVRQVTSPESVFSRISNHISDAEHAICVHRSKTFKLPRN